MSFTYVDRISFKFQKKINLLPAADHDYIRPLLLWWKRLQLQQLLMKTLLLKGLSQF